MQYGYFLTAQFIMALKYMEFVSWLFLRHAT